MGRRVEDREGLATRAGGWVGTREQLCWRGRAACLQRVGARGGGRRRSRGCPLLGAFSEAQWSLGGDVEEKLCGFGCVILRREMGAKVLGLMAASQLVHS